MGAVLGEDERIDTILVVATVRIVLLEVWAATVTKADSLEVRKSPGTADRVVEGLSKAGKHPSAVVAVVVVEDGLLQTVGDGAVASQTTPADVDNLGVLNQMVISISQTYGLHLVIEFQIGSQLNKTDIIDDALGIVARVDNEARPTGNALVWGVRV